MGSEELVRMKQGKAEESDIIGGNDPHRIVMVDESVSDRPADRQNLLLRWLLLAMWVRIPSNDEVIRKKRL